MQLDRAEGWERQEGGDGGGSTGTCPDNLWQPVRGRMEREALQVYLRRLEVGIPAEVLVAGPQEGP